MRRITPNVEVQSYSRVAQQVAGIGWKGATCCKGGMVCHEALDVHVFGPFPRDQRVLLLLHDEARADPGEHHHDDDHHHGIG